MWYKVKTYPSDSKLKFSGGWKLKSFYIVEMLLLHASEQININLLKNVVEKHIPPLPGKNTMKQSNLTINTRNYWITELLLMIKWRG